VRNNNEVSRKSPPTLALSLLCIAFLTVIATALGPTLAHVNDLEWTEHQRFHAFREVFMASLFSCVGIALCLGPLRKGEAYALRAVGVLGFGLVGGFWLGLPLTGAGTSDMTPYINHGLQAFALFVGLFLARHAGDNNCE